MKVLHVLNHALPQFSSYSLRSDYIVRTQKRLGLEPVVLTSPLQRDVTGSCERIDGIDFYRAGWPGFSSPSKIHALHMVKHMICVGALSKEIRRLAGELKLDVIHSHAPSLNGLAAARASAHIDVPWIYELRYYDEDASEDQGKGRYNSLRNRTAQRLEQSVLQQAVCVVTTSAASSEDLMRRGIPANKIFEVPHGVDTHQFMPRDPDPELIAKYRFTDKTVIGFPELPDADEDLELLVQGILLLVRERPGVMLLVMAEGEIAERMKRCIPEIYRDRFIFAGEVQREEMSRYYSLMDIVVGWRVRTRQTGLRPPLNLLEAMAMGRVVAACGLDAVRELLNDGERGVVLEPGDSKTVATGLARLVDDRALRHSFGDRARDFIVRERDWSKIVERYLPVYEKAKERR